MINLENILTIDAGNTRSKWGLFNASGGLLAHGVYLNTALANAHFPAAPRIVISNVAGESIKTQLTALLPNNASITWLVAPKQACGVTNNYQTPATLGSDRWAALIAAWHITSAPCVVVNAGTAVTIDALSLIDQQAVFLGGVILPGLNLMQQSLGQATAQLPKLPENTTAHQVNLFATNTADAIQNGALTAITGAIMLMLQQLSSQTKMMPNIIISGGNAAPLYENLRHYVTNPALIVDNLVLQGLYLSHTTATNFIQSEAQ